MTHRCFDFTAMAPRDCYKLLIGSVVPRPIAWVTTVSPDGIVNAAPYRFFKCLSSDPPILALGVENKPGQTFKDTAWNVRTTEQFTVNIVDDANMAAMNITATPFPPDIDELATAGLTAVPGESVISPRIAEAPVSFECQRHTTIEVGKERRALDFGADCVINRAEQRFEDAVLAFTGGKLVDKIVDSTGASILDRSFALIRTLGHVVSYGEAAGKPYDNLWERLVRGSLTFTRLHLGHLDCRSDAWGKAADSMLAHLRDGSISVPIEGVFPLTEATAMFERLATRQVAGKLLLAIL